MTEASAKLDEHLAASIAELAPAAKQPAMTAATPKLSGLHEAFGKFTQRVEAAADRLHKRMDSVGGFTENAVDKFGSAIDKVEAHAKSIDDAANQMTNGGPPMGNSGT